MQYTTYLRWGVLTGLFAVLFVPFIVADGGNMWQLITHGQPGGSFLYIPWSNYYFPYITGKNFVFRLIVEIIAVLYVILALREPKYRPRASWIMWTALAFVAWMAVATIFSVDATKSFWSNFERMEGYIGLLHMLVYFVIAGVMLSAHNLWEKFFKTSVAASVVMGLFGLFQALQWFGMHPSSQSGARADAAFGNAIYLGVYMLVNIFLTLYLMALAAQRGKLAGWAGAWYGIALVLQFMGLYLTQTRGALLGLVAGLVVGLIWIAWQAREREWAALRKWSIGGLVALAVVAGAFVVFRDSLKDQPGTIGRLASISLQDKTSYARFFTIWPTAIKGGLEKPLTGWGQENFSYIFNANYDPQMYDQEQWFDRAHNQFLDWLVAGGVPALLLYIALYALAAWAVVRSQLNAPAQAALLGLLAGAAVNNFFVFDNLMSSVYAFTVLAFAHGLSKRELPAHLWFSRPVSDHGIAVAAPVVAVVVLAGAWALNVPGMARAGTLVGALGTASDPTMALKAYNDALGQNAWPGTQLGYQETTEQLTNYASNSVAPSQVQAPVKQAYYLLTEGAMQQLMAARKDDARLELFLSGFYSQFGQTDKALVHIQRALELSPGKQQILSQLGLTYLNMGNKEEALKVLKQSYDEAPANDQALILYAAALYFVGDATSGDALLVQRYGSAVVDDDRLLGVYEQLKLWDRAIAIRKMRVEKSPEDVQINFLLAQTYFAAGRTAETIAQLRKVAQLSPAQAGQINTLIEQIQSGKLKPGQ